MTCRSDNISPGRQYFTMIKVVSKYGVYNLIMHGEYFKMLCSFVFVQKKKFDIFNNEFVKTSMSSSLRVWSTLKHLVKKTVAFSSINVSINFSLRQSQGIHKHYTANFTNYKPSYHMKNEHNKILLKLLECKHMYYMTKRYCWYCCSLTTCQPLWVLLSCLAEKGRKGLEEAVEDTETRHKRE